MRSSSALPRLVLEGNSGERGGVMGINQRVGAADAQRDAGPDDPVFEQPEAFSRALRSALGTPSRTLERQGRNHEE